MVIRLFAVVMALVVPFAHALGQGGTPNLIGTWQFVSRVDRDAAGHEWVEPTLGRSPLGFLIYDAGGHVAAQLMARGRHPGTCSEQSASISGNSTSICGYDAYFGRYELDVAKSTVTHVLEGSLSPTDVGKRLSRRYRVAGDTLTLAFETTGVAGRRVTRTLVLHRISP